MKKMVLIATLIMAIFTLSACTGANDDYDKDGNNNVELINLTLEELAAYDGKDGSLAYIAVNDIIYDVTDEWNNGSHNGVNAGTDASEQINGAPHGTGILDELEIVGYVVEEMDTTDPVLTIDSSKEYEQGTEEPDWTMFASANEGTITVDDSMVDMSTVGTFTVEYTATDEAGNTSSGTLNVTITEPVLLQLTLVELAAYDGTNGNPAYVAVNGLIYDVTDEWNNGMHNGNTAGTDVSTAINSAPHGLSILSGLEIVGELVDE